MAKPVTKAVLTLNSIVGRQVNVSTSGTRPGAGTRLSTWSMDWADGSKENGRDYPPIDLQHDYVADGQYKTTLTVTDTKGKSSPVNLMLIVRNPVVVAPAAPSNLQSVLITNNRIDLSWQINANNADVQELEVSIDGGPFQLRTNLPANQSSFSDTQVS